MSRKWRNILIGVLVVAALVVGFLLLDRGPDNYYEKYKDTYAAYMKAYAESPRATEPVAVDVSAYTFNEEKEQEFLKEQAELAQKAAEEQARLEAQAEEETEQSVDGTGEAISDNPEAAVPEETPESAAPAGGEAAADQQEGDEGSAEESGADEEPGEGEPAETEDGAEEPASAETANTPDKLEMTWTIQVPKAGLYNISVDYELSGEESVERGILVNGASPFDEAQKVEFYAEGEKVTVNGNVRTAFCRDDLGDYPSPYVFWFNEGENTVTLSATDEKRMTVRGITLTPPVSDTSNAEGLISYDLYKEAYSTVPAVSAPVEINITDFDGDGEIRDEGVLTAEGSEITWTIPDIPAPGGLYNIRMEYVTLNEEDTDRGIDIERILRINGEIPFSGADTLTFSRMWVDETEKKKDNQGNDIRPKQVEKTGTQTVYFKDSLGYQTEPYAFYFREGSNTLTLKAVNERMIIRSITLTPIVQYPTYEAYLENAQKDHPNVSMTDTGRNYIQKVQGEDAVLRSSPSLYARYDRSSSETEPYSVSNTILNYIGGDPWTHPGEWIEWDFYVPEDGYYNISIKARQMYQRGALSARTLYIDGEVPFDAMEAVTFAYNTAWEMRTLADAAGTPYRFFLEKGFHKIRLEVTMGQMGPVLNDVKESIERLNSIYLKILVLTGVQPDRFRDYNLAKVYPDAIRRMERESKRLYKIVDDIVSITGQKSDRAAVAQTLAIQLETFVESNERITESFANFKDNITSLGTAMQNMSESKLDVDLIMITGDNAKVPEVHDNFFRSAAHEIRSCVSSFFVDYNSLGDKYDDTDDVLEVWITTGRDQSTVLKTMVDDTFTAKTGIKVNVKLVQADAILTAVVAGNGPDVVMSVSGWFAVNYAMRNAVEDLTQFEGYDEIVQKFQPSILQPLTYNNGTKVGVYGLPETMNFNLLFYREDILQKYGIPIPDETTTWDDLIAELPTIQGHSLTVAVPFPDIAVADISVLNSMIYQNGGAIYDKDAKHTVIDSEAGVAAFKRYTSLYNDYGLPVVYDFVSRFRSGEMPLGIVSYATYNTLMVSAPEIRGRWNFTLFPGTAVKDEDGNPVLDENGNPVVDHTVQTDGLCCMMVATDNEQTKKNAWEFMKWWVDTEAQVRFGREMESILGASARYQTANMEALEKLAWSSDQLEVLKKQMAQTRGFPEIAGGYSTTRHITNAIRRVINTKEDPRETLLNYARTINEEIRIKRKEFGLPLD